MTRASRANRAAPALCLALLLLSTTAMAATTPARRAAAPARRPAPPKLLAPIGQLTAEARMKEEEGDYAGAAKRLRELRVRVAPDADLELTLALDEARSGQLDSAWTRLTRPLLDSALADSTNPARRQDYVFNQREAIWRNGRYDGWHWYVARARAELALATGRWDTACDAALLAVAARPMAGKEHLLLAVAAGRAGRDSVAAAAARRAAQLDPTLPEAHWLAGLWAWRAGDRASARASFERSVGADSAFRAAALSLVRLRLPGSRPDSLPVEFLTGIRRTAALTSPLHPKLEETPRHDQPAAALGAPAMTLSDEQKARLQLTKPLRIFVTVLVDEQGRPVLNELPWIAIGAIPESLVADLTRLSGTWRFRPAQRLGHPIPCWASLELTLQP
ncbi:MAG: hypothetical protein IT348_10580 [Candidatus Eisenbacteria bacterium]|nr:hypothetical protein [Candidatus Eisenbacteria bacterium]